MQERRELEENYVHFKSVFGSHSPTKGAVSSPAKGIGSDETSPNPEEEELDESNPFFDDESNPFATDDVANQQVFKSQTIGPCFNTGFPMRER